MNIHGKIVTLRAIEESDLAQFHAWGNDPELWRLLGGWHFPASSESTKTWIRNQIDDRNNIRLAITTSTDGLVGLANILDIDWKNRHAFHGMMLGNSATRGKGIGQDTVMAIMRYAFDELGLNRLDGSMIDYNHASIGLYCDKCGWQKEGIQRDWYYRDGRYWDKLMVGVTHQDYRTLLEKTRYWEETHDYPCLSVKS
ncbi:MAG: GNAT family N-acetyltransferase [Candidatus Paracaedibacteraceae bacterium]|nr:GNAT family N-acetyltransferase [Candidatus Paracaedibacteraceae bacterium]